MKFRVLVGILTIAIIVLFSLVVKFSYDLKMHEKELEEAYEVLKEEKKVSDSLRLVTERHFHDLAVATDSIYFSTAKNTNTFKAYRVYINTMGKEGGNYNAALVNINSLMPNEGYVQLIESNGNMLFEKFTQVENFPDDPIFFNQKPSVSKNNVYVAKKGRTVRNGVIGNPDYPNTSSTGMVVNPGQIVKVIEKIESGDSTWALIAFGN